MLAGVEDDEEIERRGYEHHRYFSPLAVRGTDEIQGHDEEERAEVHQLVGDAAMLDQRGDAAHGDLKEIDGQSRAYSKLPSSLTGAAQERNQGDDHPQQQITKRHKKILAQVRIRGPA